MIRSDYQEVYSKDWVNKNLRNLNHEFVILRQIIPWQKIINRLKDYYSEKEGRLGLNLCMMVGLLLLGKIRGVGDAKSLDMVRENEYARYFCHVALDDMILCDRTSLVQFRKRIGVEGIQFIEESIFYELRKAGVINKDMSLLDSSVLCSNILYPNDVDLVKKAIDQMTDIFKKENWEIFWSQKEIKQWWKDFNLGKKSNVKLFLKSFLLCLNPFFQDFSSSISF